MIGFLHARAHRPDAGQHQHIAAADAALFDRGHRGLFADENARRALHVINALRIHDARINRSGFDHRTFRRQIAARENQSAAHAPRPGLLGREDDFIGADPVLLLEQFAGNASGVRTAPTNPDSRPRFCR